MDRIAVLRAYTRLIELGSFTAVARELRVKQSTVSKWLVALEDQLGVQLLDRTTRSRRVTELGARFYQRALVVLDAYDSALSDIQHDDPTPRGRVRMNLPVVFGQRYIVPLMTKFLRRHKELELEMVFSDRYVRLVEEGFDLAIRIGVQVDSALRSHALAGSERRLVASPGYLRAHGTPETPRELERHQCLRHSNLETGAVWTFARDGKTHRATVRGRASANNSEATLTMARSGLGICRLASWLVDGDLRAGRLVHLLPDYQPPRAPIRALTPPGRHLAPRVRATIDHIRQGLRKALADDRAGAWRVRGDDR